MDNHLLHEVKHRPYLRAPTYQPSLPLLENRTSLGVFYLLATSISWLCWAPLVLYRLGFLENAPTAYLHFYGALGPLIASFVTALLVEGRTGFVHLVKRLHLRAIRWVAIALMAPIIGFAVVVLTSSLLKVPPQFDAFATSSEFKDLNRGLYVLAVLFFYGFGEEMGWRGFALPRLQASYSALASSLIIGFGWALWHLPLFWFAPGMSSMGTGAVLGWVASILTGSVLMTALFNQSRGSVVAVALFHGVLDIVMTAHISPALPPALSVLIVIAAVGSAIRFGPKNLSSLEREYCCFTQAPRSLPESGLIPVKVNTVFATSEVRQAHPVHVPHDS